jgi:hypothetical protein
MIANFYDAPPPPISYKINVFHNLCGKQLTYFRVFLCCIVGTFPLCLLVTMELQPTVHAFFTCSVTIFLTHFPGIRSDT